MPPPAGSPSGPGSVPAGSKAAPPPMQFGTGAGRMIANNAGNWLAPGSFLWGTLPGSADFDYAAEAGDLWLNGAVGAALSWISDNFWEPDLRVEALSAGGAWVPAPDDASLDALDLIRNPNPDYDADTLFAALLLSWYVAGVAYAVKARARAGRKMYLYFVPWYEIQPNWKDDGTDYITNYWHVVDGRRTLLAKEDVVAFRRGMDPRNIRAGVPPLAAVLREVCSDNYASVYSAALLRNFGIPGVLIQPMDANDTLDEVSREQITEEWQEKTTGENRGRPVVSSVRLKIDQLSLSPEKLALDRMRSFPEERICAAFKLSPMVLNLPSGKDAKTYANYGEARRAAYHDCLIPLQKAFARAFSRQILPDFYAPTERATRRFTWDYSRVEAVGEDQDAKAKRVIGLVTGGLMMRAEGRAMIGLPATKDDEVYYLPRGQQVISGDNLPVIAVPDLDDADVPPGGEEEADTDPLAAAPTEDAPDVAESEAGRGANTVPGKKSAPDGDPAGGHGPPGDSAEAETEAKAAGLDLPPANPRGDGPTDATDPASVAAARRRMRAAIAAAGFSGADTAHLDTAGRHAVVLAIRGATRAELREMGDAFLAEHGSTKGVIGDAFRAIKAKAARVLRESFLAAALALAGPDPTPAVMEAVDAQVRAQEDYLAKFAAAVDSGEQPVDGTMAARLESYGSAVWGAAQAGAQAAAGAAGATEAKRVLGVSPQHCDECEQLAGDWAPLSEIVPIGSTICLANCNCHLVYR